MRNPIFECSENFGAPPRRFSLWDRMTYLRVSKPTWLRLCSADKLNILFGKLDSLFTDGVIVWGHIIQANQLMFEKGRMNCPGELVYSLADPLRADPESLGRIAHELFSLKGTQPKDPELSPIAEYLTDELMRVYGLAVPSSISPTLRCRISTTFFVRKHLPGRRLCMPLLPIVVQPQPPYVAMPLPERFWPDELVRWWTQ